MTFPSLSGLPPNPTDWFSASASAIRTPASTASNADPFLFKILKEASLAGIPCSHVEITIGLFLFTLIFFLPARRIGLASPTAPALIKLRRFMIF